MFKSDIISSVTEKKLPTFVCKLPLKSFIYELRGQVKYITISKKFAQMICFIIFRDIFEKLASQNIVPVTKQSLNSYM